MMKNIKNIFVNTFENAYLMVFIKYVEILRTISQNPEYVKHFVLN